MKTRKLVAIYRPKWLHSEGARESVLLRNFDLKRCCLGFVGKKIGLTDTQLLNKKTPACVVSGNWRGLLYEEQVSNVCQNMMGENDGSGTEVTLKRMALSAGFRFVFTNSQLVEWFINTVLR